MIMVILAAALAAPSALAARQPCPAGLSAGTLVVSNMNDNTATLIDVARCAVLATLPTGEGPHEVAASHDGRWVVVSNYGVRGRPGNSLTVIDLAHAAVARTIDLGVYRRPHGMAFLPGDSVLAVTSEVSQAILLVDLRTDRVTGTLPTRGRVSHMLAVPERGAPIFNTNIADGTISRSTGVAGDSATVFPAARVDEGIAVSPDGERVWVGSNRDSIVVVISGTTGLPLDTLRGFGLPYRMVVTPDGARAMVSDPARSEIRIFDARTFRLLHVMLVPAEGLVPTAEVPGSASPEGVAVSRDSRWGFVTLQGANRVVTVDLEQGLLVASEPTGTWSDGIAFSPFVVGRAP